MFDYFGNGFHTLYVIKHLKATILSDGGPCPWPAPWPCRSERPATVSLHVILASTKDRLIWWRKLSLRVSLPIGLTDNIHLESSTNKHNLTNGKAYVYLFLLLEWKNLLLVVTPGEIIGDPWFFAQTSGVGCVWWWCHRKYFISCVTA